MFHPRQGLPNLHPIPAWIVPAWLDVICRPDIIRSTPDRSNRCRTQLIEAQPGVTSILENSAFISKMPFARHPASSYLSRPRKQSRRSKFPSRSYRNYLLHGEAACSCLLPDLWVIWGQCCPRVAAALNLPNGPITQLSPYFTRKPGISKQYVWT